MALDLCISVCTGGKFLSFDCARNSCLYLDLESTKRRPKSRLKQILKDEKYPENLYLITGTDNVGRLGEGFEFQIEHQLQEHPGIKLIVVDVFQLIRKPAKGNQTGYDRDYDDFQVLKQLADSHGVALLLIHHTRKMRDPSDVFNELSGSVGIMGALDCAWVISKEDRYSEEGTLHVTGRDMEARKLTIRFDKDVFRWQYIGTAEEVESRRLMEEYDQSPIIETIRKLIKQNHGHWEGSASDIVDASKYLSRQIYDDVRSVGNFIVKYEGLLWDVDGIHYDVKRTGKKRLYY